jgi:hypothetical protein
MFHRLLTITTAACAGSMLAWASAAAENRVALVIGNSAYQQVPALINSANDANAVSAMLKSAGFDVSLKLDLNQTDMRREIGAFSAKIADKGPDNVALVFYAGHGLQMEGESYLLPVDARIDRPADVPIEAIRLSDVTRTLETVPSRMRIVILDACRNNPFAERAKIAGHGLAIVDAPTGSIVAYSTAPGSEAEDGTGSDSPFTSALLSVITEPNLEIERFFKQVRLRVNKATDGRQTPWESSSLTGNFAFFGTSKFGETKGRSTENESRQRLSLEQIRSQPAEAAYSLVIEEDSVEFYKEFLKVYAAGPLAQRVRGILALRLETMAWYNAVTINSVASYEAFLASYGLSEYAATASQLLERARQRGINPITAAALAVPASLSAVCPPTPPRSLTPTRASAPRAPTPTRTTEPRSPPPTRATAPGRPLPAPPVIIEHHPPPVIIDRHVKKGGKDPTDSGHSKGKTAHSTGRHPGPGDRSMSAHHQGDDGGEIAGALLGLGLGMAIGGGFHHHGGGGSSGGYHH